MLKRIEGEFVKPHLYLEICEFSDKIEVSLELEVKGAYKKILDAYFPLSGEKRKIPYIMFYRPLKLSSKEDMGALKFVYSVLLRAVDISFNKKYSNHKNLPKIELRRGKSGEEYIWINPRPYFFYNKEDVERLIEELERFHRQLYKGDLVC